MEGAMEVEGATEVEGDTAVEGDTEVEGEGDICLARKVLHLLVWVHHRVLGGKG